MIFTNPLALRFGNTSHWRTHNYSWYKSQIYISNQYDIHLYSYIEKFLSHFKILEKKFSIFITDYSLIKYNDSNRFLCYFYSAFLEDCLINFLCKYLYFGVRYKLFMNIYRYHFFNLISKYLKVFIKNYYKTFFINTNYKQNIIIKPLLLAVGTITPSLVTLYITKRLLHGFKLSRVINTTLFQVRVYRSLYPENKIIGYKTRWDGRFSRKDRATHALKITGSVHLSTFRIPI
jgi:hypothetical protein